MDTISQACPQCSALLELPASAVGRLARCPACQATFRLEAPLPEENTPVELASSFSPTSVTKPAAESLPSSFPYSSNPYSVNPGMSGMASMLDVPVEKTEIRVVKAKIDEIFSATWEIFTSRWQPLILAGLIVFGLTFVLGLMLGGAGVLAAPGGPLADHAETIQIISFGLQALIGLIGWYLYLGLVGVALRAARGQEVSPMQVFISPATLLRAFVVILPLVALGLAPTLFFSNVQQGQAPDFSLIAIALGISLASSLFQAFVLLFVWPTIFLAADERSGGFSILGQAFSIATKNLLNGFLMGLILMACGMIAGVTCGLGGIATTPFTALLGTVAYLIMTSQPISRPNNTPTVTPNYDFTPTPRV